MKIGILTGGGDAPGLNAAIRAVVRKASDYGYEVVGIQDGWAGLLEGRNVPLTWEKVKDMVIEGGTLLGSSRTNPYKEEKGEEKVLRETDRLKLDGLIAMGGEDTLGAADKLHRKGLSVVGVPKTIDNDLSATDYTIGFDTGVARAAEGLERLHTTARSHHRTLVVEIMGRHAGWITLYAAIAGGAHLALIPEVPFGMEEICQLLKERYEKGPGYALLAVAEGAKPKEEKELATVVKAKDAFGHIRLGGIASFLSKEIEKRTGYETRSVVLGHLQRGGEPTPFDRILATRYGLRAVELVKEGKFGQMVSLRGTEISSVPLEEAVGKLKTVPPQLYEEVRLLFG